MKHNEQFENLSHTNNVWSHSNIATLLSKYFALAELIFVSHKKHAL